MSLDSVVLEVMTVRVPSDRQAAARDMWRSIDEQHLPGDLRRRLAANGLRCGLVGLHLPEELRTILSEQDKNQDTDGPVGVQISEDKLATPQRLHCRAGRRSELVACSGREELPVVLAGETGDVRGQTFRSARGLFALKAFPLGDRRTRLEITPEIHHGQPQQRIVGHEGAFRMQLSQDREVFEQFRISVVLSAGQTLLLTSTSQAKGLGGQFFVEDTQGVPRQKLLLVRISQTRQDDLHRDKSSPPENEEQTDGLPVLQ